MERPNTVAGLIEKRRELTALYTLYGLPNHQDGVVRATKAKAEASEEHFDGKTTESPDGAADANTPGAEAGEKHLGGKTTKKPAAE